MPLWFLCPSSWWTATFCKVTNRRSWLEFKNPSANLVKRYCPSVLEILKKYLSSSSSGILTNASLRTTSNLCWSKSPSMLGAEGIIFGIGWNCRFRALQINCDSNPIWDRIVILMRLLEYGRCLPVFNFEEFRVSSFWINKWMDEWRFYDSVFNLTIQVRQKKRYSHWS